MLSGSRECSFLPDLEDLRLHVRYRMPSEDDAVSRLYVEAVPGFDSFGRESIALTLSARGGFGSGDADSLDSRLGLAREWIVQGFADVTSERMHRHWERER